MDAKIAKNINRRKLLHFRANTAELSEIALLAALWGVNLSEALRRCVNDTAARHGLEGGLNITQPLVENESDNAG